MSGERMTPERLAEIRRYLTDLREVTGPDFETFRPLLMIDDLLIELDAVTRERDEARKDSAPVTEGQLAAWEAVAEKATAGPWEKVERPAGADVTLLRTHWQIGRCESPLTGVAFAFGNDDGNATLIAIARTALPALIAEVRALRSQAAPNAPRAPFRVSCPECHRTGTAAYSDYLPWCSRECMKASGKGE